MKYRKNCPFTLIEILVVIGIIMILSGFMLPALYQAKFRAKYMRWFAYNNSLNRDPNLIINFNFNKKGFWVKGKEVVHNGGEGCTIDGYKPDEYHGEIKDYPLWLNRGGRWMMHNKAMLFDGANDYIEVKGNEVFKIKTGNDNFSALCWVKLEELSGLKVIMSKSLWPNYSQFVIYTQGDNIKAEIGATTLKYDGPDVRTDRWIQIALTNKSGVGTLFINGEPQDSGGTGTGGGQIIIWHVPRTGSGHVLTIGANGWNGHKHHPGDYIISTNPDEYFNTQYENELENSKFLIGAAGYLDGTRDDFFKGKIDEVEFIKRGMNSSDIRGYYEMGNPY